MKHTCCDNKYAQLSGECKACDAEEQERMNEVDVTCEHGIDEDDCLECGAKYDAMADRAREAKEWAEYH